MGGAEWSEFLRSSHLFGRPCVDPEGTEYEANVVAPCGKAGSVCMFNNQVWVRRGYFLCVHACR